jgi:uncharacterized membrane protein YcfT
LLSGLFLARVIDRPWRGYLDKKVVHYSYFFLLWTFINLALLFAVGELSGSATDFGVEFWQMSTSWPWMMLWFIQMLPAYFLFTKLTRRVPVWVMLVVASSLQTFPQIVEAVVHAVPVLGGDRILIDEFWVRYIYFYVGYVAAPYFFRLAEMMKSKVLLATVGLAVWATLNGSLVHFGFSKAPFVGLFLGFAGATAIVTLGAIASKFDLVRWLRYLGENSIVVYLTFYWPMYFAAELLLGASLFTDDHATFGVIVTAAGILGSVVLFWIVRRSPYTSWLFERPTWLYIGHYETRSEPRNRTAVQVKPLP